MRKPIYPFALTLSTNKVMSTLGDMVVTKGQEGTGEGGDTTRPDPGTNLSADRDLMDFIKANSEELQELIMQRGQERERERLEALQRLLEGRNGDDESGADKDVHHRRRRPEENPDADQTAKLIQDRVDQQMQKQVQKVVDAALGRETEADPDFTPFTKDITDAPLPENFQTARNHTMDWGIRMITCTIVSPSLRHTGCQRKICA